MSNRLLLIPLLLLLLLSAAAQPPSLYFERITVQSGLSHNKVNAILQDKRGFMWLGTDDGLNRFDGHQYTIFRNDQENKSSISGNIITGLLEDNEGLLWIATTDGGLSKYDYRQPPDKQFTQYRHLPGDTSSIPVNALNALLEDRQQRLWLASSNSSIIIFDKLSHIFTNLRIPGPKTILSLSMDKSGMIWAGRQGGSIAKIDPFSLKIEIDPRYTRLYGNLPHSEISSLFRDRFNDMWFGSWDKRLYRYSAGPMEEEIKQSPDKGSFREDDILCFAEDAQGLLWLGGHYEGLQIYDRKTNQFLQYSYDPSKEGTVADNRINSIYRDRSGSMWVGTNKGVSVSNPVQQQFVQNFLSADKILAPVVYAIYETPEKDILFGTNKGLFIRKEGSHELIHQPLKYKGEELSVTFFFKDDEQLYLGTNYSLFQFNPRTNALQLLPNTEKDTVMNKIIESRVVSVIKDSIEGHPVLLVSPYGHFITYYDLVEKKWVSRLDSTKKIIENFHLKDNLVHKFYKAANGRIWMANAMLGLGEWKKKFIPEVVYHSNDPLQKNGLSNNHVFDIIEDRRGNLWISTYGGGLHYMNTQSGEIIHIANSPNLLQGLQLDQRGNVWMISNGDIYRYDLGKKTFTPFPLPDQEKSGGVSGNIFKDSKGRMYVSGLNYFISFHPDSVHMDRTVPQIYFTDFQIFGSSFSHLLLNNKIVLPYYQNTISVAFAAPSYTFSTPIRFAYKLQGINSDWIQGDPSNIANYANLDGGDYVFMVKMTNGANGQAQIATLNITIIPPYWKRWWFYALCGILVSLMIWLVYRYRINELVKRQTIRNKIAQDLHDNMGSALSSISIYGRVAQIQNARNEKQRLQEVLEKITATSTDVITEMNDIVWTINPRNDSMEKIVQRMESYARPLASAENIQFEFTFDKELLGINLNMEKRKNFYLIFKEAFNNSVKYAGAGKIITHICVQRNRVIMEITDDGKGFDLDKTLKTTESRPGGNGLINMTMRASEMRGSCLVRSEPGKGSSITLEFPY